MGILICGLNGAGKSTLGKALAARLGFRFIDSEDLYFPETNPRAPYTAPRSREEAEALLLREIRAHENFVFASVKGDYGEAVLPFFRCAVLLTVPKDLRMQRVRARSLQKFGERMLPGGDLQAQEEEFLRFAAARPENTVEEWLRSLQCPVIRADGTRPVSENVDFIIEKLQGQISVYCSLQ